ncbi:hybrid sensor histidine kinase/response regulator transcription factor [Filimonas effusa]|uniref:histidine kinase n=1 Tax=Filimonas effusa TaxID=2508721 RepID=A0A4Q1DAZ3_9BACT|nr:hybrid sensor histidine kinase/response regulator transcription factor [Filimonas effusa]RXK86591.1 hybrid sensor histidine kinase/response regulator [Filimonas effusa]
MKFASVYGKTDVRYVRCFFVILSLSIINAYGQHKYKIEQYSTEQGLSHRRVNCLFKDREGFMWFGTWDGINRFDGHSFVSFKSTPKDKYQLGNSRIGRILEDQLDHLWIQAYDYQIYRFDKKTQQFLPLSSFIAAAARRKIEFNNILQAANGWVWFQTKMDGIFCVSQTDMSGEHIIQYATQSTTDYFLPSDTINFFHIGSENRIWIGTSNGLACLEASPSGIFKNSKTVTCAIANGMSVTAYEEDAGHIYFGAANGNLFLFDKKTKRFSAKKITSGTVNGLLSSKKAPVLYASSSLGEVISLNTTNQQLSVSHYQYKENLSSLYEDKAGYLWIEPEKSGAIRYHPQSRSFQLFSVKTEEALSDINNRFFWVLEDYKGTVWVSMKGKGFGYFTSPGKTPEYSLPTPDGTNYQLPANITGHYYDKAGILWLTTREGKLIKVVIQDNDFEQQRLQDQESAKSGNEVRGMNYDRQGRLWVGLKTDRLAVYQNNARVTNLFENEPPGGMIGVYAILQDSRGHFWLGTKDHGLYKAVPVNKEATRFRLTHFESHKNVPDSLPCNQIYSIVEDKQGRIWMGSLDNGLVLIEEGAHGTRFIQSGKAFDKYPKGGYQNIRSMCIDKDGNIWMGTTNGLLVLDANEKHSTAYQYKTYRTIPGDQESLGNNGILFIYRDTKNRMWLATSGGGICQATGNNPLQSLRFRNYTTKDGLANDYILSCTEDKQGDLWLATENGLSKFKPETQTFRNYDSYDALPPTIDFSEASVARITSGNQLFFGTVNGYISFAPDKIAASRIEADMAFTGVQINNEDAGPRNNEELLKTDINYTPQITLKYNQNIISIFYAILDHRGSGDQQGFAYRLIGFDTTWHNNLQFRKATYTNLPSGHYVFEVKSLSKDLYSNQPYKRLEITILPPPWKTWWAYLLYAIIIGVILFFIRRYTLAMIRLRHDIAVEQRLAALKMHFFTNVSHELRTPLTLIVNPLEQVARKGNLTPEIASYIEVARKNASRMVRFINQLLDLRKVQSDKATLRVTKLDIISFVKIVTDHFREAARGKRIALEVICDEKEITVWGDAEKLDVVVYNLLANAIKFTPEGKCIEVVVKRVPGEDCVTIAVHDQGPGVPAENLEDIFELFQEGAHANTRELKGSGIGLALSRDFVHLHDGKIWAENNADGGLTVTVKLKTGAAHYKPEEVSLADPNPVNLVVEKPIEQQILSQIESNSVTTHRDAPIVLLVEDNDELRAFIKVQLSEYYRVETAKDGEEGLQKAIQLLPDLIVSDIMMPKMDGIQMLDRLKHDALTSHIPVVLLSAKYSIESQMEGLRYGADYYITKPFNTAFLIASIDNLLEQRKRLFEALIDKKKAIELSPEPIVVTSRDETFLREVIKIVESRMDDTEFNMDAVAESMALSRTTFYKKFKSLTTLTPMEFVRDMRLQRAKQYLDAGGHNVSEVAFHTGFSNPKYFSTCFKEKYHMSPSDYLRSKNTQA